VNFFRRTLLLIDTKKKWKIIKMVAKTFGFFEILAKRITDVGRTRLNKGENGSLKEIKDLCTGSYFFAYAFKNIETHLFF
jgi:hypothetical protein